MPEEKTLRTTDSRIDFVTPEEIKAFLAERDGTCLSLFQPTYRGAESEQNPIHLKNLLKEAASKLEECGVRKPEIDDLLSPLKSLLNREDFWRHQLDGLALFRSKDFFAYYRLPFELEDKVVLNDRFYIRPLLPALAEGHFYILALSQDQARLFKATRHGVVEIDLTGLGVPLSLAEALRYDDLQKPELQHHPVTGPGRTALGQQAPPGNEAGRRHGFHGHGEHGDEHKTEVRRFFQALDTGICKLLANETAPLVIASVEYLRPIYREVTGCRHVLDKGPDGNPDQQSGVELLEAAWPYAEEHFRAPIEEAKERYLSLEAQGLSSCELQEVLQALHVGRVDTLFVAEGSEQWGAFDVAEGKATLHVEPETGDEELVDLAVRKAIEQGGRVYVVQGDEMPVHEPVAALYRF